MGKLSNVYRAVLLLIMIHVLGGVKAGDYQPPTCDRMQVITMRCDSLRNLGKYDEIEQLLGPELVRASGIADSCAHMSYLFSTLALTYEQLGDTIMPEHFHHKAQELAAGYEGIMAGPDSTEIYRQRMNTLHDFIKQSKMSFSKKNLAYLELMNQLADAMFYYGNTLEVIHIGETILKLASDSLLLNEMVVGSIYVPLLSSYSWENNMDRVNKLLPEAIDFYKLYPQYGENEATLNLYIAQYALERKAYATAILYLRRAEKTEIDKKGERHRQIKEMIKLCEKNI